jgi:hypothetical protein
MASVRLGKDGLGCMITRLIYLSIFAVCDVLASAALADATWITVWEKASPITPGTIGAQLRMDRESSQVDVRSIVRSKGVAYFRWRYYVSSKGDLLCKVDSRVCDGSGEAVNCDQYKFLRGNKWLPLESKYANAAFMSAAQFACKF